jgi:adenylylsulfate kinase
MIYWFTGQPAHGKTTLAKMLYNDLKKVYGDDNVFHIDGDDIRLLFNNNDYSINGRVNNVNVAQKISHYLLSKNKIIIVSIVSPYIDQREDFKKLIGSKLIEIYVHRNKDTERDKYKSIAYIKPNNNYIDIDTTIDDEIKSYNELKNILNGK